MTNYLIIGNGVAGTTAAEAIRKEDQQGRITMISEEDLPFYYRIRLPDFVAGKIDEQRLLAKKPAWYAGQEITLLTNQRVLDLCPETKTVRTVTGDLPYDRLLLATGSHAFVPPIPGAELPGVFTLRGIADARAIRDYATQGQRVVVIGGGLLGLESGQALRALGKEVTVVEFFPRLLPRQLDEEGAKRLQGMMERQHGFSFRLAARTLAIAGSERGLTEVSLEDGETIPCDMVILSAGVRANLELAKAAGLDCDRGVRVNERLETSTPGIFAAGDVAEFGGQPPSGIWPAASEQGTIAGRNMAGGNAVYQGTTPANTLKVVGIELASAGEIDIERRYQAQITATEVSYRKIVSNGQQVIGFILLGDIKDCGRLTRAIAEKAPLTSI